MMFKFVSHTGNLLELAGLKGSPVRQFNEPGANSQAFYYCLTGNDFRLFLHNFMYLIYAVEPCAKHGSHKEHSCHVLAYFCLTLCECVPLFSQIEISDEKTPRAADPLQDILHL